MDSVDAETPTDTPTSPEAPVSYRERFKDERLSMPAGIRVSLASSLAFITGMGLGVSHGGLMAGLRFQAENAHRLPNTTTGWYLYHKSKNYHVMLGGLKEGLRMGVRNAFWTATFFLIEDAVDNAMEAKDVVSTAVAGLGTAGAFSLWHQFPMHTAARTAKLGLKIGIGYGLAQDIISLFRGRKISYVDFMREKAEKWQ